MRKLRNVKPAHRCLGSGLIALDIVYPTRRGAKAFLSIGGSCGNVLSILNAFGIEAIPVVQLGYDEAGKVLIDALKRCDFDVHYVTRAKGTGTPIIVQTFISDRHGSNKHSFSFNCPDTGAKLPRFRPVAMETARHIARTLGKVDSYYSDRLVPSTHLLAEASRKQDALVFLEPSARFTRNEFLSTAPIAHVLKVSHELITRNDRILDAVWNPVQIVTAGEKGLWYRMGLRPGIFGPWHRLTADSVRHVVDPAGSGDWASAGVILSLLAHDWHKAIRNKGIVREAIRFGQSLAAENCRWIGAQGLLYSEQFAEFLNMATAKFVSAGSLGTILPNKIPKPSYLRARPIDFTVPCS